MRFGRSGFQQVGALGNGTPAGGKALLFNGLPSPPSSVQNKHARSSSKTKIPSLHTNMLGQDQKQSCGATRLDANASDSTRTIIRWLCLRSAAPSHIGREPRLPIALRSPFTQSGLYRALSFAQLSVTSRDRLLALHQRFQQLYEVVLDFTTSL